MATSRAYVAAFANLGAVADADERRATWRQGMAALAVAVADRRDAPLEGLDPQSLLVTVRTALADGLLADLAFLGPTAAATATFALAGSLPACAERRELDRRVLEQLHNGDADTFIALATAMAWTSRSPLAPNQRSRVAAALSAPLSAGSGADALALALIASPELQRSWFDDPSKGSLPSRALAARILERAAREALRRQRLGDEGLAIFERPSLREAWRRLLADREALVWRHAAVARGLIADADRSLAAEIDREVTPPSTATDLRRGAASLAARIEIDPAYAERCILLLDNELLGRDPGVVRGLLAGLAGAFATEPEIADEIVRRAIERCGLDGVEGLIELRRELGRVGPLAVAAATAWLTGARAADRISSDRGDDGHTALLAALTDELAGTAARGSLASHASVAREALRAGRIPEAMREARAAADAVAESAEFLERSDDTNAIERQLSFRALRELDQDFLSDGTVIALLSRSSDIPGEGNGDPLLAELQGRVLAALIGRESAVQNEAVAHPTLRLARLRALVRIIDTDAPNDALGALRERRMAAVRALLPRVRFDGSPLRRAVWAAVTRAFDAMLRDEHLELADLIAGWTTAMEPDEDFQIAREASMVPAVRATLGAYATAMAAAIAAADPGDRGSVIGAVRAAHHLVRALGTVSTPRTDVLRASFGQLVRALDSIVRTRAQRDVSAAALGRLESSASVLADLVVGARRRLGLPVTTPTSPTALRAMTLAVDRLRHGHSADVGSDAAVAAIAADDDQLPLVARLIGIAMARLSVLPIDGPPREPTAQMMAAELSEAPTESEVLIIEPLPRWIPSSRMLGGFYVIRPLGNGAGGSVFVACRAEERHAAAEQVALKVPDYDGGAARNLSLDEFEALFREEAGALLSLPKHANIARFITFDAGSRPKPILVMELVPGQTLEQVLELGGLDPHGALRLCDGIAAGLETMHAARVAHLDLKPANVILRGNSDEVTPVLVDFGLAGRRLRHGCGSLHYGAPEVWSGSAAAEPYGADVYAFACLAYEILTAEVLVGADSIAEVLAMHIDGGAESRARSQLGGDRRTAGLADLLGAALQRSVERRPSMARVRSGISSLAPDLAGLPWPIPVAD